MTIHKCDICGKEMGVWFKVILTVEASHPETNVADIIHLQGTTEICKDCKEMIMLWLTNCKSTENNIKEEN